MVTKVGGRGQVGIRGASVTDEWEQLVKLAAKRQGTTFADFIVDVTRERALAIVRHQQPDTPADTADAEGPAVSPTLPIRLEDIHADLTGRIDQLEAVIARSARRGRWRR